MRWSPRPVRWILIAASYALVATLAAFVTWQWAPGYSTPLRAEFPRRLAGHDGATPGEYRFFYATTRPSTADLLVDATPKRSGSLSFGVFHAEIAPQISVQPSVWEDPEFLKVSEPSTLTSTGFFDQLKDAKDRSPHRSVLIVVWGWKANQGANARGYLAAQEMAHASGPDFGKFVQSVIDEVRPEKLWVVAMSMGSQLVSDSFDFMISQARLADAEREIAHVVLVAPDVASDEFDHKFAAQISRLSRRLTVYVSSTDQALLLSQWLNRGSRFGRIAKARSDGGNQPEFAHADRLLALEAAGSNEIDVVDVTPINRHRNRHSFLTDDPEFLDELYIRLLKPDDPASRRLYPMRADAGAVYWILWDE